jgi:hypothetical protein
MKKSETTSPNNLIDDNNKTNDEDKNIKRKKLFIKIGILIAAIIIVIIIILACIPLYLKKDQIKSFINDQIFSTTTTTSPPIDQTTTKNAITTTTTPSIPTTTTPACKNLIKPNLVSLDDSNVCKSRSTFWPEFIQVPTMAQYGELISQQTVCQGSRLLVKCPANKLVHIVSSYYGIQPQFKNSCIKDTSKFTQCFNKVFNFYSNLKNK